MKAQLEAKVDLYNVLKNLLSLGTLQVTFTKKDGTERVMKCTTKPSCIPEDMQPIGESIIKENKEVLRAFDIENNGWRAFRIDSIKDFTLT